MGHQRERADVSAVSLLISMGVTPAAPAVTWNPSDSGPNLGFSNGNLTVYKSGGGEAHSAVRATLARDAGDVDGYYYEALIVAAGQSNFIHVGIATSGMALNGNLNNADGWAYYQETGAKRHNGVTTAYGASYTTGDVIGVLVKNGKIYFRKNGTWQGGGDPDTESGEAFSGLSGMVYPCISLYRASTPRHELTGRFAAGSFSGSLPTGAAAWDS